jgi:steroid delta-isomerase-like uncharacterized protein
VQATAPELQELRETVMAFLAAMNEHDVDKALGFLTEDAVWLEGTRVATGHPAIRELLESLWQSTSDMHMPLDDVELFVSADGDDAATFWRATMTMTGPLEGFAPTGRRAEMRGACRYAIRDGKIARHTVVYDQLGLARELGIMPETDSVPYRMMAGAQRLTRRLTRR